MANQTITLKSQRLNVLGPTPSQRWGINGWNTMKWGTNTWGLKSAGVGGVPPMIFSVVRKWSKVQTLIASSPRSYRGPNKIFSKPITVTYANTNKSETDGGGYQYIFNDRVINAESAMVYVYTSLITGTSGWTTLASSGSVVWS